MPLATVAPYVGERIIYPALTSRDRIIFSTASVNSADPCESTGTGRVFELNAATGSMLNYQVLDTNGDNLVNSFDLGVAGFAVGSGIPTVAAIFNNPNGTETKTMQDSSGAPPSGVPEVGNNQRIMWRQIQ